MNHQPGWQHRRSIRLQGYDYAQAGVYFVTVCTQNRACLLGQIDAGEMRLNDAGRMVQAIWHDMPSHYPGVDVDAFVVMPNHIHGIVLVGATPRGRPNAHDTPDVGATPRGCPDVTQGQAHQGQARGPAPTGAGLSLPDAVHRLKTMTTKRYTDGVKQSGWPAFSGRLWQRNYYEHIIRNEDSLARIREYIANNPMQWALDRENPVNLIAQGKL